jgi:hypothetical protein
MALPEPKPVSDRGFNAYAGGPFRTDYGHTIRVQESSAAMGPHVWLFIGDSDLPSMADKHSPHLNLEQAVRLRAALDQFINGVSERWENGDILLAVAVREVYGD